MNQNVYCVILAGGIGNRFWPVSNQKCPKQFSDILNTGKSFIRQTYERIHELIPDENIFIITGAEYASLTQSQIPEIPEGNILTEPCRRSTATCIMYAAVKIRKISPEATMLVIPSDHFIVNDTAYLRNIREGIAFIERTNGLLTIGVKPTRAETQYGYIQLKGTGNENIAQVKTFTEKPDAEMAQAFFQSGDFLWNAGIFIWKVRDIIHEVKKYIYDLYALFEDDAMINTDGEQEFINSVYGESPYISIDFGVLEKSSNVFVLRGDFHWSDVGTWHAYQVINPKDENNNVKAYANTVFQDSDNCIVNVPKEKKVILCGVKDLIVAERDGVIMVCHKDNEHQIKLFDQKLKDL